MDESALLDPGAWCELSFSEHRRLLGEALRQALHDAAWVTEVSIEAGTLGREYDLTAAVRTDVGTLRTELWSHARAMTYCDGSVHPANRAQFAPGLAVSQAARRLLGRLSVPYALESRGLTIRMEPEAGVERVWTAERSLFRNRTAVTREDRVLNSGDVDVRDLLAHFYSGPSLRLVGEDGDAMLLPERSETEGRVVSLCPVGRHFSEGSHESCPECGGLTEVVIAARAGRR
ncbi:hypothetical protein BH23GEM6_BH23GEM6_20670 [soil metagenome]